MSAEKRWVIKPQGDPVKVASLAASLDIPPVLANLLVQRGIETDEEAWQFFNPRLENLHDPFLMQDMREFELYGTVRAVVSVCDSVNYILEEEDLLEVFSLVNNYLDPGGMFIFDMNTRYKYEQMGDCTIAENREESSFIWDNFYDPEEEINEYELAIFLKEQGDLYRKFEEVHYQRAYDPEVVKALLEKAGLELVAVYDAFTREPVREDSERIYFIAQECQKKEKR